MRMTAPNGPVRKPIDEPQVAQMVEAFRMLSHGTRIQLLWALIDGERSVNELVDYVGKPSPSVSQHLAKLRTSRLVTTRRLGTTIFYSIEDRHVRQLVTDAMFNAERVGSGAPVQRKGRGVTPWRGAEPHASRSGPPNLRCVR